MLVPCSSCRRHVRGDHPSCPFCGASTAGASPIAPPAMPIRVARVVAAFGIASVTSVCAAYGRSMNYELIEVDSGRDTDEAETAASWPLDTEPRDVELDVRESGDADDSRVINDTIEQ